MSINDFMNKIKAQLRIDGNTAFVVAILVLVGLCSFGLGRLSKDESLNDPNTKLEHGNGYIVKEEIGKSILIENDTKNTQSIPKEKMYVASKNGKLYYGANCSGAGRIKLENQLWFNTEQEAIDTGYSKASSCK